MRYVISLFCSFQLYIYSDPSLIQRRQNDSLQSQLDKLNSENVNLQQRLVAMKDAAKKVAETSVKK